MKKKIASAKTKKTKTKKTKTKKTKQPSILGIKKVPPLPEPYDFIRATDYRLISVEKYGWDAYGVGAMWYDADIDVEIGSAHMIVDTLSQQVCELHAIDNSAPCSQQAFRWTNPLYRDAHRAECKERGESDMDIYAWDKVKWVHVTPARIFARMKQLIKKQEAVARGNVVSKKRKVKVRGRAGHST